MSSYRHRVHRSKPTATSCSSQCLEVKGNKFLNVILLSWVEHCGQCCCQDAQHLLNTWTKHDNTSMCYAQCLVTAPFPKKVFWQKVAWNLGCLRSPTFPWGNLMDKGGQPQQKLTALQPLALQVWIHISSGWTKTLLKHRLFQESKLLTF